MNQICTKNRLLGLLKLSKTDCAVFCQKSRIYDLRNNHENLRIFSRTGTLKKFEDLQ
jgi:hypothetical protein